MPAPFRPDYERKTIPTVPMIVISFVSFLDNFCYTLVNPNIPYMCKVYFPELSDTELGFYSGWITAAYSLGGVPGNFFWGWFADRYGRRLSITLSIIGVIIAINIFGLATDFWIALFGRFLWGFLNGNLGIAKTYISEISNDYTQTLGFSIFQTVGGISSTVGPSVGGFLSRPEENIPGLTKKFPILREYRYYIPCFAACIICFIVLLTVLFFLPETLSKEDVKKNIALMKKSKEGLELLRQKRARDPKYKPTEDERIQELLMEGSYFRLMVNKKILLSVFLYGALSLIQGGHDALYPVWMINPKSSKGFEWTQTDVGYLYSLLGPVQMLSGHILFILMLNALHSTSVEWCSSYLYMFTILITPICALTLSSPSWVQWFVIYSIYAVSYVARILQFTAIIVIISNVSYPDFRGKVNGIGQVFASLGRFIGPTISTNVYAWSIQKNYPWPLDFGLIFYLLGILQLAHTLLIFYMDDSANHSTPSIRRFVKMEMEKRNVEMVEMKDQGDLKKGESGDKSNEEQETSIVAVPNL
ncbi:hypothetical protein WA171_005616 [Blastocystis sp. BT1]